MPLPRRSFTPSFAVLCLCGALSGAPSDASAQQPTQAPGTDPAAPPPPTALKLSIEAVNPEDLLDSNKTLVIPTAYVTVLTEGSVAAVKRSGMFSGSDNTVRASASYKVAGLDKAFLQQLAQTSLNDLVTRLRDAGYTVLTYQDVKDRDFVKGAQRESSAGPIGLPASSEGGNSFASAAPSDEQHFKSGFAGGAFSEFQSGGKSKFTDATLIIPHYTFHAPQAWAEGGSGYKRISAEANVAEGMNMASARAHWMGQPRVRVMRGIPGVATRQMVINVTDKAGTVVKTADTTPQAANALGSVLSMLGGGGSVQRSSGAYLLTVDRDAFTQGVLNGVRAFNTEVAKVAAEARP